MINLITKISIIAISTLLPGYCLAKYKHIILRLMASIISDITKSFDLKLIRVMVYNYTMFNPVGSYFNTFYCNKTKNVSNRVFYLRRVTI